MNYDNLSDFISELEDDEELVRIPVEVDPVLEISAITDRLCKNSSDGPAVFFENVKGHSIPVVTNLLGSRQRLCKALRVDSFDDLAARIVGLIQPDLPQSWTETLKLVPQMTQLTRLPPKSVRSGVCQQVVKMGRDVDLAELPIPQIWPDDAGPTMTAGQVFTKHPETGVRNVGLYPLEVRGRNTLVVHWNERQGGWRNFQAYQQAGRPMPLAVSLGGDPAFVYMAHAPLPVNTDECLLGGFLRGKNIELVGCRSVDLEVPAFAEIVLEGTIDPAAPLSESGPIGEGTGFYSVRSEQPVMDVTAITHRSNPICPVMIPGKPPVESDWLHQATVRLLLPFVRLFIPDVVDLHMPRCGAYRNLLFVSLRKRHPQQARQVMNALWGLDSLTTCKMIVVVDENVNVQDEQAVWFHVGANSHPGRDVLFCEGPTGSSDHAAPIRGLGHKMGIDATAKLPREGHPRPWPAPLQMTSETIDLIDRRWQEYGFDAR